MATGAIREGVADIAREPGDLPSFDENPDGRGALFGAAAPFVRSTPFESRVRRAMAGG